MNNEVLERATKEAKRDFLKRKQFMQGRPQMHDYFVNESDDEIYQTLLASKIQSYDPMYYILQPYYLMSMHFGYSKYFLSIRQIFISELQGELQKQFETLLTLFLLILNSIAKTSRTSNAFTIPPIKLFTQTLTRYTHSLSRP